MMKNMELYQTFSGGAAPRWSSVDLQLQSYFFRVGALPNTPLSWSRTNVLETSVLRVMHRSRLGAVSLLILLYVYLSVLRARHYSGRLHLLVRK
jgi:hypothetical protein